MDDLRNALTGLQNICSYCEQISYAVHRFGSRDDFMEDYAYQATCAFSLLQIGEIVKTNYDMLIRESPDFQWSDFVRFRDFSAHNYHKVDYDIMWNCIMEDVPLIWNEALVVLERYSDNSHLNVSENRKPKASKRRFFR